MTNQFSELIYTDCMCELQKNLTLLRGKEQ